MAEPARAGIIFPVENHVVVVITAGTHGYRIQPQFIADPPRNDVIGTGRVSTQTETADNFALLAIKWEATAEHNNAATGFANHRIK